MDTIVERSFIEFLKENNKIIVPEIQREYVWGSYDSLYGQLLKSIYSSEEGYNIGFIYSYRENNSTYLIDGQQRFTTIYLILFYLYTITENENRELLKKFSYSVRNITKEFLRLIFKNFKTKDDFSNIKSKTWFLNIYSKDPTINNIINLFDNLETIGTRYDINERIAKLEKTRFFYFNMSDTSQGEELYIKMNSRGEPLKAYENVRSIILDSIKDSDKKEKAKIFNAIEHFFWQNRYKNNNNADYEFNTFLSQIIALKQYNSAKNKNTHSIGSIDNITAKLSSLILEKNYALYLIEKMENFHASLEKLLEIIDEYKKLFPEISKNKKVAKEVLGVSTIIIPYFYIVENIFEFDFNDINLKDWVRFLYNISYNHRSTAIVSILNKINDIVENNNSRNIYQYFQKIQSEKDKEIVNEYYKKYNGYRAGFDLLESEINKIKFLSFFDNNNRESLHNLFIELENHSVLGGNIDYLIQYSLEKCNYDNFIKCFEKYKEIFEDCFSFILDNQDNKRDKKIKLIKALLTFVNKDEVYKKYYFNTHMIYIRWTNSRDGVHVFSLCDRVKDWKHSFQNTNNNYDSNSFYKALFFKVDENNNIEKVIENEINNFIKLPEENKNIFYKIIEDDKYKNSNGQTIFSYSKDLHIAFNFHNMEESFIILSASDFHGYDLKYEDFKKVD